LVLAAFAAARAYSQRIEPGMLDQLPSATWEIRQRGTGSSIEGFCVQDGQSLIQLGHRHPNCERQVVNDGTSEVAVQYTCGGHGQDLTRSRKETDRQVQTDSQGVANGQPFSFLAEGQRVGDCAS
jgi:hypothetical protein